MKVTVLDAWEEEGKVSLRYSVKFPGREAIEGSVALVSQPKDDESTFLERALPIIRTRHHCGPLLSGLRAIIGKTIDDELDPEAPQDPPSQ